MASIVTEKKKFALNFRFSAECRNDCLNFRDALTTQLQYLASFVDCQHCEHNKIKVKFLLGCLISDSMFSFTFAGCSESSTPRALVSRISSDLFRRDLVFVLGMFIDL